MSLNNPKDPQQKKVYKWEETFVTPWDIKDGPFESLDAIRSYIYFVLRKEGYSDKIQMKNLSETNMTQTGGYFILDEDSCLGKKVPTFAFHIDRKISYTSKYIILHEISHFIKDRNKIKGADHGPTFMGIYIKMLAKYLQFPLFYAESTLMECKIKYSYNGWNDITY